MYGYIYKTTNLINGKIYIGQHKQNKFEVTYFGSGKAIKNALNKYGTDKFTVELLEWCDTRDETNLREQYWIKHYNSTNRQIGYNITAGGEGFNGAKHSEETKQKISKSRTGVIPNRTWVVSEDMKLKISNTLKEYFKTHDNPRKGVKLSDETKQKLRQANLGKRWSLEQHAKMDGRTSWNKGVPMSDKAKQHLREINTGRVVKRRTVGQYDKHDKLINTYISCADAARKTGLSRIGIVKVCLGYRKHYKNFNWRYLD